MLPLFPDKDKQMPDLIPEEDMEEELVIPQEVQSLAEQFAKPKKKAGIRAELVLGLIALLCLGLFVFVLVLCLPYMLDSDYDEDPESYVGPSHQLMLELEDPEAVPPATMPEVEEEDTNPTIPPEANPYDRFDFQYNANNYLTCLRQDSYPGIDVSAYQGEIDWQKVKDSGIRFAIIRLGFRGYGQAGKMVEDEMAQRNLEEATKVGLPIGAYFFSQALSIQEADEEIEMMLSILGDYKLDMPLILDWEIPGVDNPRTKNMDARTLTDIQRHYCRTISEKGYTPMVYFNWYQASNLLFLHELEDYPFWLALYQDRMTYPFKVEMWQYTDSGRVPGIAGNVDLNVYMP